MNWTPFNDDWIATDAEREAANEAAQIVLDHINPEEDELDRLKHHIADRVGNRFSEGMTAQEVANAVLDEFRGGD